MDKAKGILMRARQVSEVMALESSGLAATVHVINVSGRQRMLSQRMAKQALLAAAGAAAKNTPAGAAAAPQAGLAMSATAQAFELGMAMLTQAPLSTSEIRATLVAAQVAWASLRDAVARTHEPAGRLQVAVASEDLLELFDRLTGAYQHSMQVLMG